MIDLVVTILDAIFWLLMCVTWYFLGADSVSKENNHNKERYILFALAFVILLVITYLRMLQVSVGSTPTKLIKGLAF